MSAERAELWKSFTERPVRIRESCQPTGWHHFLVSLQDSWVMFLVGYLECRVERFADEVVYLDRASLSEQTGWRHLPVLSSSFFFSFFCMRELYFTDASLAWWTADWTFGQTWQPRCHRKVAEPRCTQMHKRTIHTHTHTRVQKTHIHSH